MLDNLDQPSLSYDDADIKHAIFVNQGVYTIYVNRVGQAALLWDLWWLATEAPNLEDTSIWTEWKARDENVGTPIGYCEMSVPDKQASSLSYDAENDRLDIYVTRHDAEMAFLRLQPVGRINCDYRRVRLLDNVWIERLDEADWMKKFIPTKSK